MPQNCSTNYTCTPIWYTIADSEEEGGTDVVLTAKGPYAPDVNVTCVVNAGNIQFQVKDADGDWFTPAEASYTVTDSNLVRIPRSNMPDIRVLATVDATFYIEGAL